MSLEVDLVGTKALMIVERFLNKLMTFDTYKLLSPNATHLSKHCKVSAFNILPIGNSEIFLNLRIVQSPVSAITLPKLRPYEEVYKRL